MCSLVIVEKVE